MRYDLRALARARGIRRKGITFRPIEPTAALAALLASPARDVVALIEAEVRNVLLPAYTPRPAITQDDAASGISDALAAIGNTVRRLVVGISATTRRWAARVEEWHRPKFAANVKAGTGADVVAYLHAPDAEDQVAAASRWAASLIQGLTDDLRKEVESLTWAAYANQTPRDELAKQIAIRVGIARGRADFIARDQTSKIAAKLDELRAQEAGLGSYKWRHSGKVHFRPEHLAREGKIFRWDSPPHDGHPGTQPNCGCRAQAYLDLSE